MMGGVLMGDVEGRCCVCAGMRSAVCSVQCAVCAGVVTLGYRCSRDFALLKVKILLGWPSGPGCQWWCVIPRGGLHVEKIRRRWSSTGE